MRTTYIPFCRHTKTNGRICQSPAVSDSAYCYHHQKLRHTGRRTPGVGPGLSGNVLDSLHNARSIHHAIAMVYSGLATGQIPPKRAGRMLFALNVATASLDRTPLGSIFWP